MLKLLSKGIVEMPKVINLGCGSELKEDQVNIDVHIPDSVRYYSNIKNCWIFQGEILSPHELPKNYFKTINATMVMEHVHLDNIPNLLYCLYEFLQPNGKLYIKVPNFKQAAKMYMDSCDLGSFDMSKLTLLREITYQLLDPTLDSNEGGRGHQSLWTPELAYFWLSNEGFNPINIKPLGNWVMDITAVKPSTNPFSISCNHG